jgi:5-methylcytosine-specific restriction endonuclease McrA
MHSVLLLNASYEPLRVVSAERAVVLILQGKAEPITESEHVMRSPSTEVRVPLVARLVSMAKVPRMQRVPFSRKMLAVRDNYECQFNHCSNRGTTVEHLLPSSRGGKSTYENCVMSCGPCNFKKANRTLEEMGWELKQKPVPVYGPMVLLARAGTNAALPEWAEWLPAGA